LKPPAVDLLPPSGVNSPEDRHRPYPNRRRGAQPRNANALKHDLYAALQSKANPSGSAASAGDTLQDAITRLRAVIDQLYQAAESLEDKIKLSSAPGVATVRLSTLLRTQKFLSPDSRSEVDEALHQAIYNLNKEWGRI